MLLTWQCLLFSWSCLSEYPESPCHPSQPCWRRLQHPEVATQCTCHVLMKLLNQCQWWWWYLLFDQLLESPLLPCQQSPPLLHQTQYSPQYSQSTSSDTNSAAECSRQSAFLILTHRNKLHLSVEFSCMSSITSNIISRNSNIQIVGLLCRHVARPNCCTASHPSYSFNLIYKISCFLHETTTLTSVCTLTLIVTNNIHEEQMTKLLQPSLIH